MTQYTDDILKRVWTYPDGTSRQSRAWYGRMRHAGGPWKWVKLTTDRRSSLRKWEQLKQQADMRTAGVVTDDTERLARPLDVLLAEYHAGLRAQRCSPDHVTISEQMWARILELTGWTHFRHVTLARALDLLARLERADATASYRNKHVMRLKAFVNAVLPENWPDPLRKLRRVRERGAKQTRARRAASDADLSALLAVPRARARRLAYALAAYNGLRRNEVRALLWSDVSDVTGLPTVSVRRKMGSDDARDVIPLHPYVVRLMGPRSTGPVVPSVPDVKTLAKDWKRAGVAFADEKGRRLDYHALRHTFASALDRAGASRTTKKRLMRHLSGDVTDGYSHAELRELSGTLNRVPGPAEPVQAVSGSCPVPEKPSGIQGVFVGSGESTWVSGRGTGEFSGQTAVGQWQHAYACQGVQIPGDSRRNGAAGELLTNGRARSMSANERQWAGAPCPVRVRFPLRGVIRSFAPGGARDALRAAGYRVTRRGAR